MATVANIAARPYQEIGYVLFIEGWPIAWTNRYELAGSGAGSWIGEEEDYGLGRTVVLGLEPPESVKLAIGLVESGMLTDDSCTFSLVDRDGHLVEFVEDDPGTYIIHRLGPLDDPAPELILGKGGNDVTVWDAWVNGESIGPAGERRRFQILPGNPLPGYDHAGLNTLEGETTLRPSTVQQAARWLEGRPCALYLIRKDPETGTWASWEDQYDSGYSLIWWGTTRGVSAQSRAWKVEC